MRLWSFKGGLPSLAEHKNESTGLAIEAAPIPDELIYPLRQHIGNAAAAIVNAGDRVLRGQKIAEANGMISAPIHAASSGIVKGVFEREIPHPSGFSAPCIVIEPDGLDEELTPEPATNYRDLNPTEIIQKVRNAGIVGLGGAAFPTAIKIDNQSKARDIKTLILNGAECEPYISCDDRLLKERATNIIQGIEILQYLLEPEQAIIAIEDNAPDTFAWLTKAINEHKNTTIQVVQVPTIYPTGGEKQLIQTLTGKEVPSGHIPADIGVVAINVGTVYAIQQAIIEGKPLTSRITTVTGEGIETPRNLEVRIGSPISTLVEFCDGYTNNTERLIMGGPMMGFALLNDDIPLVKATNCILIPSKQEIVTKKDSMPCIRCGLCASACPISLLPQQLFWYSKSDQLDKAENHNLFDCIECGCCDVVCPSHIPLVQHFRHAKSAINVRNHDNHKSDIARERFEAREERLATEKAERARKKRERLKKKPAKAEILQAVARSKEKKALTSTDENTAAESVKPIESTKPPVEGR